MLSVNSWVRLDVAWRLAALSLASAEPVQIDASAAELMETQYVVHCRGTRVRLSVAERLYPEERHESMDLADRWRTDLLSFGVEGRRIPAEDIAAVSARISEFAWIERVRGGSSGDGDDVQLEIRGMRADAWARFGLGELAERPAPTIIVIRVGPEGRVTIP